LVASMTPRISLIVLLAFLALEPLEPRGLAFAQTPPYLPSDLIQDISFDFSTEFSAGDGSDQWVMTWADDGHLYAAWGDGEGWNVQFGSKQTLGITRISSNSPRPALSGAQDVFGSPSPNRKPLGLIADTNSTIYLFFDTNRDDWKGSYGAMSTDNGRSWSFQSDPVFHQDIDGVKVVGIAQFGPGYTDIPEGVDASYFYVYLANRTDGQEATGKDVFLARVPKRDIFNRAAYQYYNGLDKSESPIWSSNWNNKKAVFHDDAGMGYHVSVTYNPGLGRFIYAKGHSINHLGIFEGPNLWGPWHTVYYGPFKDEFWKFTYQFPQKWVSGDGRTMWLAFSGWPEHDKVSFIKTTLSLNPGKASLAPTIEAGPDQSIALVAGASLDGVVSDDGLPDPPGAVTTTWSKVSGPGEVIFANPTAVDTMATFTREGLYVLRLTADDGELITSIDVTVNINASIR
jgi:hypothetical protein